MIPPSLAAARFAAAWGLGLGLGVIYSLLRPIRSRAGNFADGVFLLAFGAAWVYLGFGICRADLRLVYTLGMVLGTVCWELTLGRVLRPTISAAYLGIGRIFSKCFLKAGAFFDYFPKIRKKELQRRKKRVQ